MTTDASPRARHPVIEWVIWIAILAVTTLAMLAVRARLNQAHVALAYLLVVQGGSARGGRPLGVALAAAAFLCFDVLFLPPFGTLVIQDPLNWLVLVAFLATSLLSAQLLYRARAEAAGARDRAAEIDRLSALGAETLNAARAEDALGAIVGVIRTTLPIDECFVHTSPPGASVPVPAESVFGSALALPSGSPNAADSLATWVLTEGRNAALRLDATTAVDADRSLLRDGSARAFLRPLQVRGATVGVLRVGCSTGLALSPADVRVLDALAYYAALGVERVRLGAEAERAERLQEAHRAKDAVLASVSHDLRTPLTTIKGLAHEIAEEGDDRAAIIEDEADRLNTFVAQLLDLSRIASGSATPDVQINEAEDLIGATAQRVAGRLGNHELRIQILGNGALQFGRFDFAQTLRALVNLVENAAKYSPPGTPIDLVARREGATLRFGVGDRGPGVAAADRERIFEPFYRRDMNVPDAGGVGLGLSIARGVAEAQGGSVTVAPRPGGGSEFTLTVPAIDETSLASLEPVRTGD